MTSRPRGLPKNILLHPDHVSILHRWLLFILRTYISNQAVNPSKLYVCILKRYQQGSLMAQALISSLVDELTSYSKLNKELDTTVQIMRSYEEDHVISYLQTWNLKIRGKLLGKNNPWRDYSSFQVHASDFRGPTPGSGSCFRLPGLAISPALELNGNVP